MYSPFSSSNHNPVGGHAMLAPPMLSCDAFDHRPQCVKTFVRDVAYLSLAATASQAELVMQEAQICDVRAEQAQKKQSSKVRVKPCESNSSGKRDNRAGAVALWLLDHKLPPATTTVTMVVNLTGHDALPATQVNQAQKEQCGIVRVEPWGAKSDYERELITGVRVQRPGESICHQATRLR